MASGHGGKNTMGRGAQGKGTGTGAMTTMPDDMVGENMILSNRDKAQNSDERGLDSKQIQTEQHQDHSANRYKDDDE